MRTVTSVLFSILFFSFFSGSVKAESLYLPVVAQQLHTDTTDSTATFQVDHIRLWHVGENGNQPTSIQPCAQQHKVQVHIFDRQGDRGPQARLNGVIVHVVHLDNGRRTEEFRATGLPGVGAGVVEFELKQFAEVSVFTDIDGRQISSQRVLVSTLPQMIATERLINSGYCQDEVSCQSFVNANRCVGQFSWNVVFKRNY